MLYHRFLIDSTTDLATGVQTFLGAMDEALGEHGLAGLIPRDGEALVWLPHYQVPLAALAASLPPGTPADGTIIADLYAGVLMTKAQGEPESEGYVPPEPRGVGVDMALRLRGSALPVQTVSALFGAFWDGGLAGEHTPEEWALLLDPQAEPTPYMERGGVKLFRAKLTHPQHTFAGLEGL